MFYIILSFTSKQRNFGYIREMNMNKRLPGAQIAHMVPVLQKILRPTIGRKSYRMLKSYDQIRTNDLQ